MARQIKKVGVLGSGLMGSGIAAHLANASVPVLMLDIAPGGLTDEERAKGLSLEDGAVRNRVVQGGMKNLLKSKPALLMDPGRAALIETGNFEDDWERLRECDWIVEVVVERLDIKQQVFSKVEEIWEPGTIVTSNTSGIALRDMLEGRSEEFRRHFLVTHFFNPVRYMRLLELVAGPDTDQEIIDTVADFGSRVLGKGIVFGKDTPNFVANRIGVFNFAATMSAMVELGYQIDEVDTISGAPLARPKSATFGTADLVGVDTLLHTFRTSREGAPDDEGQAYYTAPDFVQQMQARGALGRKSGFGFFRMDRSGGKKNLQVLDWTTGEYRDRQRPDAPSLKAAKKIHDPGERLKATVNADDRAGVFAWRLIRETLAYSSNRFGEVADTVADIDRAVRWGYSWELGPFEAWDALGVADTVERMKADGSAPAPWVEAMLAAGHSSFYRYGAAGKEMYDPRSEGYIPVDRPAGFLVLDELEKADKVVYQNDSAKLFDLGDGVAGIAFRSRFQPKMNPLDDQMLTGILEGLAHAERNFDALVVHHQGENFSAGANLAGILQAAKAEQWETLDTLIQQFQHATTSLQRASIPVVTAPFGYALGGGAEVTLGGDAIVAHAETYMGLVEVGVGLIPAGGGTLFLLQRFAEAGSKPELDNLGAVKKAFETVAMAKVSTSADHARKLGFLGAGDLVDLNRDRQLASAKSLARALADAGYRRPLPRTFHLPGRAGIATLKMQLHNMHINGWISEFDKVVGTHVANIFCGGDGTIRTAVSEDRILELEREAFISLCGEANTQARIEHMLKTGKPLRN
ncbi:MAG: 3-hydroxyacyl-CoA dehydrogenase NAD-binding domain-containing protein [Acidobacteriota bacterium]